MADKPYLQWLHGQPCAMQPCGAATQAHHSTNAPAEQHGKSLGGRRGKSQRPDDAHAFPLCLRHHGQFHDASGPFRGWDREARRAWQDEQVRWHRERWESHRADHATPGTTCPPELGRAFVPELESNDPKAVARGFCEARGLGGQIALDLERVIRRFTDGRAF
jgi:hypothetical protein